MLQVVYEYRVRNLDACLLAGTANYVAREDSPLNEICDARLRTQVVIGVARHMIKTMPAVVQLTE